MASQVASLQAKVAAQEKELKRLRALVKKPVSFRSHCYVNYCELKLVMCSLITVTCELCFSVLYTTLGKSC